MKETQLNAYQLCDFNKIWGNCLFANSSFRQLLNFPIKSTILNELNCNSVIVRKNNREKIQLAKAGFGEVLESREKIQLAKGGIEEIPESRFTQKKLYRKNSKSLLRLEHTG
jgi:hypothetical protein